MSNSNAQMNNEVNNDDDLLDEYQVQQIQLIDSEQSNIYQYASKVVFTGYKKFLLEPPLKKDN